MVHMIAPYTTPWNTKFAFIGFNLKLSWAFTYTYCEIYPHQVLYTQKKLVLLAWLIKFCRVVCLPPSSEICTRFCKTFFPDEMWVLVGGRHAAVRTQDYFPAPALNKLPTTSSHPSTPYSPRGILINNSTRLKPIKSELRGGQCTCFVWWCR